MISPEVTVDDVDWSSGDSTLLYDLRFCFLAEELQALARAHGRCPGLVHCELRRDMDGEAVARVFGLQGIGVGDSSGGSTSTAGLEEDAGKTKGDDAGLDQKPGYVTVESEELDLDYVLVGAADEVERERRREADAEAALAAGWNDRVRSIDQLLNEVEVEEEAAHTAARNQHDVRSVEQLLDLDEAGDEEDAITARRKKLARDIDRFLEEEAGIDAGGNIVIPVIEQYFAAINNEKAAVRSSR